MTFRKNKNEAKFSSSKVNPGKYPAGPVDPHKTLATGESLEQSRSERRIGGSKKDLSRGSNR
jgi:hypothetical protein